jgi:multiple sugar transport system substrate-binding protein
MKRWLTAMATFALVAAACTAGGGSSDTPSAVDTGSGASHAPVELNMWGAWTGRELQQFNKIFDGFTEKYPWITVKSTGGVNDQKIIAAISAGNPPDTVLSFTLDSVGQFCASGAWQDLNPYIEQSGFDVSQFPPSVEAYTSFAGSRCAFPFLTDAQGLYYNTDMFDKAGITDAPKTLSELQDDAKKLTVFNADGSIKVAGFVPWFGYYEFSTPNLGNLFGAKWYTDDGSASVVDSDPAWKTMFQWQHDFIAAVYGDGDFQTGADKLQRFVAGAGDEFSSANDFEAGRTAMNFDGEWRTAFIADEVPDLPYATAPYPVPDDQADTYGRGPVGGTIIGIPKGSPHPDEAWLLVDYMATDTATLTYMANNVRNVPTTIESLSSPDLDVTPQFQTFLDIFQNPDSHYKEPSAIGASDQNILTAWADRWEAGKETDLNGGLASVAQQINDQLAQAAI